LKISYPRVIRDENEEQTESTDAQKEEADGETCSIFKNFPERLLVEPRKYLLQDHIEEAKNW